MDAYRILQLRKDASQEEIKKSYLRLARIHHPDKGGSNFVLIKQAFDELTNPNAYKSNAVNKIVHTLDLEELSPEDDKYAFTCRCGNQIIVSEDDLVHSVDINCPGCSIVYVLQ
jgi:hypothetical protein